MKKNLMFAMFGAIALTGAVELTSCSSSDDVAADVNPNYNPETNEVTTQFELPHVSQEQPLRHPPL